MSEFEFEDVEFDFGKMLDEGVDELKKGFTPGEKVAGVVVDITRSSILLDVNAKSEGILDRSLLEEEGELTVKVGDTVEAYYVGQDGGEIVLTTKMKSQDVDDAELENAFNAQIPVEGKVEGTNSAGLEVKVGSARGFCPASQVDTYHVEELSAYVGQVLTFMILEYSSGNLVLSRRLYLEGQKEEKRKALEESLSEGDIVTGMARKIMDFGVFVDLGGVDGLIPMSEIAWERVKDASEYVTEGERIAVKVLKIDWDAERITLSLKQAGSDPWDNIETEYRTGVPYSGTVTRLASFGAFVQLKPGVEGLIHISKLGAGRRLSHPREVVEEGQDIEVFIESIDLERHRISLTVEKPQDAPASGEGEQILAIGSEMTGTVQEVKPYGVFVQLTPNQTGLLHVSEMAEEIGGNRQAWLQKEYPVNKQVKVVVKDVRDGKISLSVPGRKEASNEIKKMMNDQKKESEGFGSLGGLFDNL